MPVVVLGAPYDANSSYLRGAALAPRLIQEAFHCESSNSSAENGVDLAEGELIQFAGDIDFESRPFFSAIHDDVTRAMANGRNVICLGGDHSVTYPIVAAHAAKYANLQILHFDAHPDLYENFNDNRYSHASPFARIMEDRLAVRLVQVGLRTVNQHQRKQIQKYGVESFEMNQWRSDLTLQFDGPVYITVDLDALDPAFAPGVSHWEPGGLTTRDLIGVIQRLRAPAIIGADIVEYNPTRDSGGVTAMVAAKILKEIAARMLHPDNGL